MAERGTESKPLAPRRSLGKSDAEGAASPEQTTEQTRGRRRTSTSDPDAKTTATRKRTTAGTPKPASASADTTSGASTSDDKPAVSERVGSALRSTGENLRAVTANAAAAAQAAAAPSPAQSRPVRRTRRARLRLVRLDPWSIMKTSFLLSIAFGIVTVVAVGIVWGVLGAAGVWDSINTTVQQVIGGDSKETFDVQDYLGTSRVMGFTMLVAVVDVILITAISTLTAFLYNLAAALLGGVEMTLAEDDR